MVHTECEITLMLSMFFLFTCTDIDWIDVTSTDRIQVWRWWRWWCWAFSLFLVPTIWWYFFRGCHFCEFAQPCQSQRLSYYQINDNMWECAWSRTMSKCWVTPLGLHRLHTLCKARAYIMQLPIDLPITQHLDWHIIHRRCGLQAQVFMLQYYLFWIIYLYAIYLFLLTTWEFHSIFIWSQSAGLKVATDAALRQCFPGESKLSL